MSAKLDPLSLSYAIAAVAEAFHGDEDAARAAIDELLAGQADTAEPVTEDVTSSDFSAVGGQQFAVTGERRRSTLVEEVKHRFSCALFDLSRAGYSRSQGSPLPRLKELADSIPDEILADDGREEDRHLTVKFGLHTSDPDDVRHVVEGFGTVTIRLGGVSIFPAKDGANYDVVKVDVLGNDVRRLNQAICAALPHTDTHPTFNPHVTLAYVRAGAGAQFVGPSGVEGMELLLDELTFSDTEGNRTRIPLGGRSLYESESNPADPIDHHADGEHLARLFAGCLNALALAGEDSDDLADELSEELEETGWMLARHPRGLWIATATADPGDDEDGDGETDVLLERVIVGTDKRGYRYAYDTDLKKRVPLTDRIKGKAKDRLAAKHAAGHRVNHAALQDRLARHASVDADDSPGAYQQGNARRAAKAMLRHHGEHAAARVEELTERLEEVLGRLADAEGVEAGRARTALQAKLRQLAMVLGAMHVEVKPVQPANPTDVGTGVGETVASGVPGGIEKPNERRVQLTIQPAVTSAEGDELSILVVERALTGARLELQSMQYTVDHPDKFKERNPHLSDMEIEATIKKYHDQIPELQSAYDRDHEHYLALLRGLENNPEPHESAMLDALDRVGRSGMTSKMLGAEVGLPDALADRLLRTLVKDGAVNKHDGGHDSIYSTDDNPPTRKDLETHRQRRVAEIEQRVDETDRRLRKETERIEAARIASADIVGMAQKVLSEKTNVASVMKAAGFNFIKNRELRDAIAAEVDRVKSERQAKEPWQLTSAEFKGAPTIHRMQVEKAAAEGKPVPDAVLADVKFTGTDALGRKWVNGEMVAAVDEPAVPDAPAASEPDAAAWLQRQQDSGALTPKAEAVATAKKTFAALRKGDYKPAESVKQANEKVDAARLELIAAYTGGQQSNAALDRAHRLFQSGMMDAKRYDQAGSKNVKAHDRIDRALSAYREAIAWQEAVRARHPELFSQSADAAKDEPAVPDAPAASEPVMVAPAVTPDAPTVAEPDVQPEPPADTTAASPNVFPRQRELDDLIGKMDKYRQIWDRPTETPGAFVTGRSGRSKSLDRALDRENNRRADAFREWKKIKEEKERLEIIKDGYLKGESHANGQPRADSPSRQRQAAAVATLGDYYRSVIKPGDKVSLGGDPNRLLTVKRVNPKSISTTSGSTWQYDEITPLGADGKPLSRQQIRDGINAMRLDAEASSSVSDAGLVPPPPAPGTAEHYTAWKASAGLTPRPGEAALTPQQEERARQRYQAETGTAAPAPTPAAEEPGFTGTDSLGREWVNGELVAKQEEPSNVERTARPDDATTAGRPGTVDGGTGGSSDGRTTVGGRIVTARSQHTRPADPELVPQGLREHLNEHQIQGAAFALNALDKHGGCLLADGTGAGKTRQELAVARTWADKGKKVLIVTKSEVIKPDWSKSKVTGSFANDSAAMGVSIKLNKGDQAIAAGEVHVTTYDRLGDIKDKIDKDTLLILDESHSLKNWGSARAKHGYEMSKKAGAVMYATATPADKPLHIAHLFRAGVFGDRKWEDTYRELGMIEKEIRTPTGQTIKKWEIDPRVGAAEVYRRMSGLFDQMTAEGLMLKREISFEGVDVGFKRVELPPEAHAAMDKIKREITGTGANKGLERALILMQQRRQQETFKIPYAVEEAKKELAEGRQVVIFASRVNESGVGDREDGSGVFSEGTAGLLRQALEDAGIAPGDIAELHGGVSPKKRRQSMDDFQAGKAKVIIATVESGGPQPYSAKVLTPHGWRLMGSLTVGDEVIAGDGTPTRIQAIFEQGVQPVFRLKTASGAETRCTADHLWSVRRWSEKNWKTRNLQFLMDHQHSKWMLPVNGVVQFESRPVPLNPYLLGLILGDGSFRNTSPTFCNLSEHVVADVKAMVEKMGIQFTAKKEGLLHTGHFHAPIAPIGTRKITKKGWAIRKVSEQQWEHVGLPQAGDARCGEKNPLTTALRKLGLWDVRGENKFIPAEYLVNGEEVRIEILRGLMDTDGSVERDGSSPSFCSKSKQLAEGVAFLVRSLGGVATIAQKSKDQCYYVKIGIEVCPFKMPEKVSRWNLQPHKRKKNNIKSITAAGQEQCRCLLLEHPSHLYVTDDFIVTHNTGVNLDDTSGDKPRTMIMLTAPFSAVENVQAAGRVWRLKTKSLPRLRYLFGDTEVDDWNSSLIAGKMKALGAAVGGQVGYLDVSDLDVSPDEEIDRMDAGKPEEKGPYQWPRLTLTPEEKKAKEEANKPVRVTGDTFAHRERLKSLGGRWDGATQSWVVPKAAADRIRTLKGLRFSDTPVPVEPEPVVQQPAAVPTAAPEPAPAPIEPVIPVSEKRRQAIHSALRQLANLDTDRARERNNVGFNQLDGAFGARLAASENLTDNQARAAAKMLAKYRRQLGDDLHAAVTTEDQPAPAPAPVPAPTPEPQPAPAASPASAPAPALTTKVVDTSRGKRHVHAFAPSQAFWSARKAGRIPDSVTVRKNDRTGAWEASIWGASPEEVAATHAELKRKGLI